MLRNFLHLSLLRAVNMLSLFVLYPYLVRTVGIENWGHLTTAFTVTTYLSLVGDFGFHQSAIRETAANSNSRAVVSNLYWTITLAKPFLILGTALLLFLLTGMYTGDWFLALVWFSGVLISLGESSSPVWLFQGMQQMHNLVYANLVARIAGIVLVFAFIRQPSDFVYALPLLGVGALLASLFSNLVLAPKLGVILPFSQSKTEFRRQFRIGYPFFLRNVGLSLYGNLPVFFLMHTGAPRDVGYFGVADKIVAMIKAVLSVFSHAIFPKLVELKPKGHAALVSYLHRFFRPYIIGVILGSLVLFVFAEPIIKLYSGADPAPIVPVLRAMAFLPVSIALAQPMDALMQVYGREKLISALLWAAGVFNFLLNMYLIPHHFAFGAALSLFITETLIVFLFLWFFEKKYRKQAYFLPNQHK